MAILNRKMSIFAIFLSMVFNKFLPLLNFNFNRNGKCCVVVDGSIATNSERLFTSFHLYINVDSFLILLTTIIDTIMVMTIYYMNVCCIMKS